MNPFKTLVAAAACAASTLCSAQQATLTDPGMLATLKKLYPATTFREVNRTSMPGIYEVVMGQNVAYVDPSGRYFLFGRLFDMQTQQDLTTATLDQVNKVDVSTLPIADAIKTVKGNGSRTLYIFSDPDCPYCKQLEKNIASLTDVTVYTFLFPLEGLHPEAKAKATAVWCSADKAAAWKALMATGAVPTAAPCATPIDRNVALGGRLGVTGTPTLIAADGRKKPGAASAEQVSQWLDAGATKVGAAQ